jgi:hypothetical protein
MSVYNVMASAEKLKLLQETFPAIRVVDRFSPTDVNVSLPDDPSYEDRFVEFCEEHTIETYDPTRIPGRKQMSEDNKTPACFIGWPSPDWSCLNSLEEFRTRYFLLK